MCRVRSFKVRMTKRKSVEPSIECYMDKEREKCILFSTASGFTFLPWTRSESVISGHFIESWIYLFISQSGGQRNISTPWPVGLFLQDK